MEGRSTALIFIAEFQANTKAETITPTRTATAKSSRTVTTVTKIITSASDFGIFVIRLIELQANVPITTMNITPTKAAIGIASISALPYKIKKVEKKELFISEEFN